MADTAHRSVQPFCMWQGLNLPNWLRFLAMRPPIHRSHWLRLGAVTANSISNSLLEGLETLVYGWKVSRTEVPSPVFVIGHWRSGTTMLHNLLSLDPRFVTPNLYQVTFPGHFLVSESWLAPLTKGLLPKTRPMDEVEVTWETLKRTRSASVCTACCRRTCKRRFTTIGPCGNRCSISKRSRVDPQSLEAGVHASAPKGDGAAPG